MIQIQGGNDSQEPGLEAIHASRMEEAIVVVLRENQLEPDDRAVLENAVRIARTLLKALKATG